MKAPNSIQKPKVGDIVRLNKYGLQTIFGSERGLSHMLTKEFKVIQIDKEPVTWPELTYPMKVDDPEISQFLIFFEKTDSQPRSVAKRTCSDEAKF
ncbi:hypothetical protein [Ferrovum sp.]|uniref:hypothetical protein n=1 Tax=Ferrovum sp. TaxID=2609467 RepID=UPI002627BAC5|nr:hypothetical protein [Ferrovum sp.]